MIGYANTGYRLSFVGASLLTGQLVRCLRRRTIVVAAMLTNVAVVGSWFAWTPPSSGTVPGLHVTALVIAWCVLNGAVIGTLRAVFYSLFPLLFAASLDHALAQVAVWDSLGMSVAFFANSRFCFGAKAGAVIAVTVVAMVTYGALEYVLARDGRRLRQDGSSSRDVAASVSAHLVANVVIIDSSLMKNDNVKRKTRVSLLVDDNQITNANCN